MEQIERDIRSIIDQRGYDDGSIGPVLVRLAWHASGTFDKVSNTGGSNGATMRFHPESSDIANAGLEHARKFLEPIKQKHPSISYADLWTLAGVVAIKYMGGPVVPWKPGRVDVSPDDVESKGTPPNGRLPDAALGADHIRAVFYRMGFNDQEIVALIGAHSLGRCHTDRSGYSGPWNHTPTKFTNQYFIKLCVLEWKKKKWSGPEQFEDPSGHLMMLPTDIALINDDKFLPYCEMYARDKDVFFKDFAAAFGKLLELGVAR